ncbi:hypothetical protein BJI67_06470 [Acidihalobacter aeolianus]|uniref:Uncharacterized protein n=1 Tax=Acidihalobacter aeolianus TaxID=2792603 RepID=A0A1D8K717_9GAMM|nr:hypothetical protein [Acidihalobacter aeolianus]AOV16754.1 hypothetical protein BJI67_06470 [Acidihalobacter aeolianus]
MNVTGVSSTFYPQINPQTTLAQQLQTQLQQIQQSLSNGNLGAAQQSYAAVQQQGTTSPQGTLGNSLVGNSTFASLGQALQSGQIGDAQTALKELLQNPGQTFQLPTSSSQTGNPTNTPAQTGSTQGGTNSFHVIA